jgi:hypothetical protein
VKTQPLSALSPREREEIERALGTERAHSTMGEVLAWAIPIGLAGAFAFFVAIATLPGLSGQLHRFEQGLGVGLRHLLKNYPFPLGFIVGPLLLIAPLRYALRRRGRRCWLALTFGVAHLNGQKVRLLRYQDVARLEFRTIVRPQKRLTLAVFHTRDGAEWLCEASTLFGHFEQALAGLTPAAGQ